MLKRRIIPIQLLIDGRLVKTVQFGSYRDVGDPVASSRVYSSQNADELIFLNIQRESRSVQGLVDLLDRVTESVFMPLSLGGGVASIADARLLIRHGADKVVVNSAAYRDCALLESVADEFGAQALIVGIDARREGPDGYTLYSDCGRQREDVTLEAHIERVTRAGAGELMITSIDNDGMMQGYDLELIRRAVACSGVPVIGSGGAGHYMHLRDAFLDGGAMALACGSLFNFGDSNPIRAKAFLANYGIPFKTI